MKTEPLSTDLKLHIRDKVDFDVDSDNELCVEIDRYDGAQRAWLTKAEGQQLLDLLTRWLK